MKTTIYLDNAATTKTAQEVVDAMLPYFTENYGNPSSIYEIAGRSKEAITKGREQIANVLGAKSEEIYFTAGGSEAEAWNKSNTDQCSRCHFKYAGKYGEARKAHTLDHKANDIDVDKRNVECRIGNQKLARLCNYHNFIRGDEQVYKILPPQHEDSEDDQRIDCAKNSSGPDSLGEPVQFSGSEVLSLQQKPSPST